MKENGAEKCNPPRARREKLLNYRKGTRRPCRNSMNCSMYKTVMRTSPGGAHTHTLTLTLSSLSFSHTRRGGHTHSLTCRSHTQSRGHTHSHLPLSHRVEGTLILTSKLKRRVESTLTPTLSLSHNGGTLSLSLSLTLSHP